MTYTYEQEIYIPFQLCDAAGIVFFGHVFALAHEVYEKFVQEKLHISWDRWFNHPEWVIPIKQTQAEYFAPLFAGQKYFVSLSIQQVTSSSFTLSYHFQKEKLLHCRIETLHVFCNRKLKVKQPIPTEINEAMQSLMFRQ